jgi:hypothetical protein
VWVERRASSPVDSFPIRTIARSVLRCPYCGNENPDDHRFCGMCGKTLPEPGDAAVLTDDEPAGRRDPEPTTPAPAYTGGIFNLGAPAEHTRNLDYLLEDDEEPKSHKGLLLLGIVAVALVGGLGYLRFRNTGLPFLKSGAINSQSSTPAPSGSGDTSIELSPANPSNTATSPAPAPSPAAAAPSNPPPSPAPENTTAAASQAAAPAQPAPSSPTTSSTAANNAGSATPPDSNTVTAPPATTAPDSTPPPPATDKPAEAPEAAAAAPAPPAKPKAATKPAPKPAPKSDAVTLGEQYIYGRGGVAQNCEKGLRYIKPAADQSNAKAMITMGALYATGHCLSRDLPTAYRYFALALRNDPDNGPLRENAESVWKQMTAEERKQAIRLTQ